MGDGNKKSNNKTEEKPVVVRNTTDLQRLKLEKLMKNPDKPVVIPERPKGRSMPAVPDFVRNVMGSSAGAGSGEFHVYRHLRRKEYARQKFIQEKSEKEKLNDAYQEKIENNRKAAEEKTAKKRAKRLKKKIKAKQNAKKPKVENTQSNSSDSEDSEQSENENKSQEEAEKDNIEDNKNETENEDSSIIGMTQIHSELIIKEDLDENMDKSQLSDSENNENENRENNDIVKKEIDEQSVNEDKSQDEKAADDNNIQEIKEEFITTKDLDENMDESQLSDREKNEKLEESNKDLLKKEIVNDSEKDDNLCTVENKIK